MSQSRKSCPRILPSAAYTAKTVKIVSEKCEATEQEQLCCRRDDVACSFQSLTVSSLSAVGEPASPQLADSANRSSTPGPEMRAGGMSTCSTCCFEFASFLRSIRFLDGLMRDMGRRKPWSNANVGWHARLGQLPSDRTRRRLLTTTMRPSFNRIEFG